MKRQDIIIEFLSAIKLPTGDTVGEILDLTTIGNISDFDELTDALQDADAFRVEIIYYGEAMRYLMDNDPGLTDSLGLAQGMGYDPIYLNSEILASILASNAANSDYQDGEIQCAVDDFFSELDGHNFCDDCEEEIPETEEYCKDCKEYQA